VLNALRNMRAHSIAACGSYRSGAIRKKMASSQATISDVVGGQMLAGAQSCVRGAQRGWRAFAAVAAELAHHGAHRPLGGSATKRKAQKGSDLADRAVEQIVDKSVPPEEQDRRKRALIKGPKEFRDIREDLPKSKT